MIEIKGLHKSFGRKKVLGGVDLKIETGETMCVIGKSGSGKSVLLKHIVGLLWPDKGSVYVEGADISKMKEKQLFQMRMSMGYVFQGAALFDSYTVYENIIIPLYEHGLKDEKILEDKAVNALSSVAMLPPMEESGNAAFIREWEILKDKKPADLSGGMKKRVGVARALVGNPKYVFYDEPTTGLDPVTSKQIDLLIAGISKKLNITSLVITHDMFSVFTAASRVAMIDEGVIRFNGSPEELKKSEDKAVKDFLERYS